MPEIVIIDYGMGNIRSVQKAFERLGISIKVTADISEIKRAKRLILPGVGHFETGIKNLFEIKDIIKEKALIEKIPIMGICLGMQLMTNFSEEGSCNGLGLVDAVTRRMNHEDIRFRTPHIGWNTLCWNKLSPVCEEITDKNLFYFVHSFHVICNNKEDVLSTTDYGFEFTSSFQHENIFGFQFHPEKSHSSGLRLLTNFCKL